MTPTEQFKRWIQTDPDAAVLFAVMPIRLIQGFTEQIVRDLRRLGFDHARLPLITALVGRADGLGVTVDLNRRTGSVCWAPTLAEREAVENAFEDLDL